MGDHMLTSLVTVATAIIGVAILAVLVSNRANTAGVITSTGQAFANDLLAAVSPVTGAQGTINTGGNGGFSFSGQGSPIPGINY